MKDADKIRLSTGKEIYAFSGIVGIRPNGESSEITYGYDGPIRVEGQDVIEDGDEHLTKQEAAELAELMIRRWTEYREHLLLGRGELLMAE